MSYKIGFDVCTYTVDDLNSFSTISENISEAKAKQLEGIGIVCRGYVHNNDKTEKIINAYFDLPDKINGLKILKGLEISLISLRRAEVDASASVISNADFTILSYYPQGFIYCEPSSSDIVATLKATVGSINVDGIGQITFCDQMSDFEDIVAFCKRNNKFIEFSNDKIKNELISENDVEKIARLCIQYNVPIVVSSGARLSYDVGNFSLAVKILEKINFPQELILNETMDKFLNFVYKY